MNSPIKHLPEPTPAETIAAFTYSLSRQEALYGVEPLNVERVIARIAQAKMAVRFEHPAMLPVTAKAE